MLPGRTVRAGVPAFATAARAAAQGLAPAAALTHAPGLALAGVRDVVLGVLIVVPDAELDALMGVLDADLGVLIVALAALVAVWELVAVLVELRVGVLVVAGMFVPEGVPCHAMVPV